MQDLLTFGWNRNRRKREDLATDALCILLCEPAGQTALRKLLGEHTLAAEPIEVSTRKRVPGCVPDVFLSQGGTMLAILEMKFWANLRESQSNGEYLKYAPRVIFIVPSERAAAVRREIAHQQPTPAVISWQQMLGYLTEDAPEMDTRSGRLFAGALEHLKEFCYVSEQEHFLPFSTEQLQNPVQDTTMEHLVWLTKELLGRAAEKELILESTRPGAGFDGSFFYGQTVTLRGLRVWIGYWPKAWKRHPEGGPLWVQIDGLARAKALKDKGYLKNAVQLEEGYAVPLFKTAVEGSSSQEDELPKLFADLSILAEEIRAGLQGESQ